MNKKVRNAKTIEYNGIIFKSKLERDCYKILLEHDIIPTYEPFKVVVWNGFKPKVKFYCAEKQFKYKENIVLRTEKIRDITYTPDFLIKINGRNVYIEVKGYENDVSPYKIKMFRKYLDENDKNALFFKIKTIKQLEEAIDIMKK